MRTHYHVIGGGNDGGAFQQERSFVDSKVRKRQKASFILLYTNFIIKLSSYT